MSKKSKKDGYVYSTDPGFDYDMDEEHVEKIAPEEQELEVHIDKKQRGGKVATLVKGYLGSDEDLKELTKALKSACGVGGSAKDGEIIIQGEKRDKVMELLKKKGFQVKRVGS